jgi:hypoxanthine phosphoribosyltransferase
MRHDNSPQMQLPLSLLPQFSTIQCFLHTRKTVEHLRVLLHQEQIARRVAEIGGQITRDFEGEAVVLIGVLKGATIFLADLARQIKLDATFDFVAVSSYGSSRQHSGQSKLVKDVDHSLEGKNVVLVEDILDTGLTLTFLKNQLLRYKPKSLKIAALLDKVSRRVQPIAVDYVGFEIPDEFVVGYGLDLAERFRNLSDICILETDESS